jgi:hypothetical protein
VENILNDKSLIHIKGIRVSISFRFPSFDHSFRLLHVMLQEKRLSLASLILIPFLVFVLYKTDLPRLQYAHHHSPPPPSIGARVASVLVPDYPLPLYETTFPRNPTEFLVSQLAPAIFSHFYPFYSSFSYTVEEI